MDFQNAWKKFVHPDLINGPIFKSIIAFTVPLTISYVFQQFYNAVDTVIIAHFLGEKSLAAMGACTSVYDLLVGFGLGFGNGMGIVAAKAFGSGEQKKLKKVAATSIVITVFVSALVMLISALFLRKGLVALGTPAEIMEESLSYISTITIFCGVLFAYNLFAGLLRAIGNSFTPLLFLIFSSALNIVLDVLLITQFSLSIRGAALATVIAQFISAILTLLYIMRKAKILVPEKKHFAPERRIYKELFGQGLSMACMGSIVNSGSVILQSAINGFGTFVIAGHISARKIFSLTNIPLLTIGLSSATFVSQNLGAGKIGRIRQGFVTSNIIALVWSFALLLLSPLCVKPLVSFISGSENSEILDYAKKYIFFMLPFHSVLGALFITRNSLQGMGRKILPLFSSVIELLGKVVFTLRIIPKLGTLGIIICEPLIWCLMLAQLLFSFTKELHKLKNENSLLQI